MKIAKGGPLAEHMTQTRDCAHQHYITGIVIICHCTSAKQNVSRIVSSKHNCYVHYKMTKLLVREPYFKLIDPFYNHSNS
jgi:hypothetical protein